MVSDIYLYQVPVKKDNSMSKDGHFSETQELSSKSKYVAILEQASTSQGDKSHSRQFLFWLNRVLRAGKNSHFSGSLTHFRSKCIAGSP